jgi:hypothetical protein
MKEILESLGTVVGGLTSGKPEAIVWLLLLLLGAIGFGSYKGARAAMTFLKEKDATHKADMDKYIDRLFKLAQEAQASSNEVANKLSDLASSLRDFQRGGR